MRIGSCVATRKSVSHNNGVTHRGVRYHRKERKKDTACFLGHQSEKVIYTYSELSGGDNESEKWVI